MERSLVMQKKICSVCHKNEVRVKITRITHGEVEEMLLCGECAAKKTPYQPDVSLEKKVQSLQKVLAEILPLAPENSLRSVSAADEPICSTCGLPFASYKQTLMLGCSDCYTAFEALLITDLNRLHKSVIHTGNRPGQNPSDVKEYRTVKQLEKRLADAVAAEDFGAAIRLRDEIRELKAAEPVSPE